jgi:glycosyltransferase involved in cell wall biosynthesis
MDCTLIDDPLTQAGDLVDLSLSIVLPVHNGESSLAHDVHLLLDLLPDITSRFEILIIDDASTDQTEEIAHELALEYPQVRVIRHQQRQGPFVAEDTAMSLTAADVVFVQDEGTQIRSAEIRQLWAMRHDEQLVMARAEMPRKTLNPHLLNRLATWGEELRDAEPDTAPRGIQMIRREAVEDLQRLGADVQGVRVSKVSGKTRC